MSYIRPVVKRKNYTDEQKLEILKEIDKGLSYKAAARKYGMSVNGLHYWRQTLVHQQQEQLKKQAVGREAQSIRRERELEKEIEKLKSKLADAFLELEFLKKAHSSMVREKKLDTSVVTAKNLAQFQEDAE